MTRAVDSGYRSLPRQGTIRSIDDGYALVAVEPAAGCARCEAGTGCGQGLLFRWFARREPIVLRLAAPSGGRAGDPVLVHIRTSSLTWSALLGYGVPLVTFLTGLSAGQALAADAGALAGGIAGLGIGVAVLRRVGRATLRAGISAVPA